MGQGEMLVTFPEASGCRNVLVEMSKLRQAQFDSKHLRLSTKVDPETPDTSG